MPPLIHERNFPDAYTGNSFSATRRVSASLASVARTDPDGAVFGSAVPQDGHAQCGAGRPGGGARARAVRVEGRAQGRGGREEGAAEDGREARAEHRITQGVYTFVFPGCNAILIAATQEDNPLIVCLIDGDGNIFSQDLLRYGLPGGRQAAALLTKGLNDHLENIDSSDAGRAQLWLTIYFNKTGLLETLTQNHVCDAEQFEAFVMGFNQASPLFSMVDVGSGKEAADSKIKGETLNDAIPSCAHGL